jgi:peptide chain release factor 1
MVGIGQLEEDLERPYKRATDHRIKRTLHRLDQILDGDLGEFTDALSAEEQRRALEAATA